MQKALWITTALVATALTAGTVYFNNAAEMADVPTGAQSPAKSSTKTLLARASATKQSREPVVVEFFTSQGCSSCPPSDRLAAKLAKEPDLLVIQRPVTYWDRLGWKDTLGKSANTELQRAYARRTLKGRNGVYTPQAVVNGAAGVVGSRESDLRQLIAVTRAGGNAPQIKIARKPDGSAEVMVMGGSASDAQVKLVGLDRSETVKVGRGENGGRTLSYTNIWKGERMLGTLMGGSASYMVDGSDRSIAGANSYAIVIRQGSAGKVLGGRMLPNA